VEHGTRFRKIIKKIWILKVFHLLTKYESLIFFLNSRLFSHLQQHQDNEDWKEKISRIFLLIHWEKLKCPRHNNNNNNMKALNFITNFHYFNIQVKPLCWDWGEYDERKNNFYCWRIHYAMLMLVDAIKVGNISFVSHVSQ
jgi:hypothetical protein